MRLIGEGAKAAVFVRAWPTFDEKTFAPNNGYSLVASNTAPAGVAGDQADRWRRIEIECTGGNLRAHVDGELVYEQDGIRNPQGYIALSTGTGAAEFRAIEVRKIERPRPERGPARQRDDGVFLPGEGLQNPRVKKQVKPQYTAAAMAARIQGAVLLEAVVLPDGRVGDVDVIQSLDPQYGLDREAIAAVKGWVFTPATRDGSPVAILVSVQLTFTLK